MNLSQEKTLIRLFRRGSSMKHRERLFLFIPCLAFALASAGRAYSQTPSSAPPGPGPRDGIVASINGKRIITEKDVDALIGTELEVLQQRMNALRKGAIDNLVTMIVLQDEAAAKGITVDQLEKNLVPDKVEVDEAQVERAFKARPPVDPDKAEEVKETIRRGLESRAKTEIYKAAVARLRSAASVKLLLDDAPAARPFRVSDSGPSRGARDAAVTVVEFADFQCPYCRQEAETLDRLLHDYAGRVRLVFKHLPLPSHPRAFRAAQASVCAAAQGKFWQFHDKVFASGDLSETALKTYTSQLGLNAAEFGRCLNLDETRNAVIADAQEGQAAGIRITPSLVINGKVLSGLVSPETLNKEIEAELRKTKAVSGISHTGAFPLMTATLRWF
jgi:protein-disulfide isomerase